MVGVPANSRYSPVLHRELVQDTRHINSMALAFICCIKVKIGVDLKEPQYLLLFIGTFYIAMCE